MKYLGNTIDEKKNELYDSVLESFMTNAKNLYFDNCMTNIDLPKEERETIVRQVQNEYPN
jgi:hypothetical protein